MIRFKQRGSFDRTKEFMQNAAKKSNVHVLDYYGQMGVDALKNATPTDTGLTADSWYYKIVKEGTTTKLQFCNSNINEGVPIAIILQLGHGTGTGGWVEGIDYINPSLGPVMNQIAELAWKEVTNS